MFRSSTKELVQFLGENFALAHPHQPKHFNLLSLSLSSPTQKRQKTESNSLLKQTSETKTETPTQTQTQKKLENVTKFEHGSVVEHAHHATLKGNRCVIVHVSTTQTNGFFLQAKTQGISPIGGLWWSAHEQDNESLSVDETMTTADEKELFNCTNIFLSCFPSQFLKTVQSKVNDDDDDPNDNDSVWMIGNVALLRDQEKKPIFADIKKIRKCAVCILPRPRAKSVKSWKALFDFLTNKSRVSGSRIIFPLDIVITQPDSMVRDLFTAASEFPITFTYHKNILPRIYLLLNPKKTTKITPTFSSNSTSLSESLF